MKVRVWERSVTPSARQCKVWDGVGLEQRVEQRSPSGGNPIYTVEERGTAALGRTQLRASVRVSIVSEDGRTRALRQRTGEKIKKRHSKCSAPRAAHTRGDTSRA
eukprot:3738753-Prymnesium_polylepis.1